MLLYSLQLFHAFFLTKLLLLRCEIIDSTQVLIMNNSIGAFKQGKKRNKQAKGNYLRDKLHKESIATVQSQNLSILKTWNSFD